MEHNLREHLDIQWKNRKINPLNRNVKKEQGTFYCYEEKEDGLHLVTIRFVKDGNCLKDHIINYIVEHDELDAKFGCSFIATGILDLDNDEPMEERWGFVDDYELIKEGDIPMIKKL